VGILLYPYFLVVFWYREFLPRCVKRSFEVFAYALELLSVPLLLSTFFKPLKGEYREGLVAFSIAMGIFVKFLILAADVLVLSAIFSVLFAVNLIVAALPLLLIGIFL
jgi:hypothetical protein